MTMNTLFGVTFEQLQTGTVEEIHEAMVKYTVEQVRHTISQIYSDDEKIHMDKFVEVYTKAIRALYEKYFDEQLLADQRKMYDTEERFELGISMASRMNNLAVEIRSIMGQVLHELHQAE